MYPVGWTVWGIMNLELPQVNRTGYLAIHTLLKMLSVRQ